MIIPPPCLHFPSKCEWSPLWILPNPSNPSFQWFPLLGSHFRLILPFVLLKIKWSLLKSSPPPGDKYWPAPKAPYFNAFLVGYTPVARCSSPKKGNALLQAIISLGMCREGGSLMRFFNPVIPTQNFVQSPTDTFNPKFRQNFAWKTRIPSFN